MEEKVSGWNGFKSIDASARPNVDWSWSGGVRSFQYSTPLIDVKSNINMTQYINRSINRLK
jgi:hypothetical protein